jgi:hypothetical protein
MRTQRLRRPIPRRWVERGGHVDVDDTGFEFNNGAVIRGH